MNKPGQIFVISAPAGTGKTTIVERLLKENAHIVESISYTTRRPRPNEQEGEHYHFVSEEDFLNKERRGDFLESARVFGNLYGTDRKDLEKTLKAGKNIILVIDTQGALAIKHKINAILIFLSPPSITELKERLTKRSTEPQEIIEERLSWAVKEMELKKHYDYHVINEDRDETYRIICSIIVAEQHRVHDLNRK